MNWFWVIIWFLAAIGVLCFLSGVSGSVYLFYLYWQFRKEEEQRKMEMYDGLKQSLYNQIDLMFQEYEQSEGDNEQGQGAIV